MVQEKMTKKFISFNKSKGSINSTNKINPREKNLMENSVMNY